jgi:hypothetical protein
MSTLYFVPDEKEAWAPARWVSEADGPKGKTHTMEKLNGEKVSREAAL